MDPKRYKYLRDLYGEELTKLEMAMFEGNYVTVQALDNLYRSKGMCLKNKDQAVRVYHDIIRTSFLDRLYDSITHSVGMPDCQTREDVREIFQLPIPLACEIQKKADFHAENLFTELQKKTLEEVSKTIWAPAPLEGAG